VQKNDKFHGYYSFSANSISCGCCFSLVTPANTAEAKAILDAERQAMEQDAVETVSAKPVMAK